MKPDWLEEVWMEVQAEIDAEELAERMDAEPADCPCARDQHELGCNWPRCRTR